MLTGRGVTVVRRRPRDVGRGAHRRLPRPGGGGRRPGGAPLPRGAARPPSTQPDRHPSAPLGHPGRPGHPGDGHPRHREPVALAHVVPAVGGPAAHVARPARPPGGLGDPGPRHAPGRAYTVLPQVRGRYRIGPLTVDVTDPFALTRLQMEFDEHEDLLVTPEIEDLERSPDPSAGTSFGSSRARQLFRTGEEYYTMRQYQEGDDLRRLHWASVARTGAADDPPGRVDAARERARVPRQPRGRRRPDRTHPPFERAVSVAATLGALLTRNGVHPAPEPRPRCRPTPVTEDRFLDTLAALGHSSSRTAGPALTHLRAGASADTSLVMVGATPAPGELTSTIRGGLGLRPEARRT